MKQCTKCGKEKPEESFSWKNKTKGRRSPICKECQAKYHKKHYEDNKEKYKAKAHDHTKKMREWFKEYKATLKCSVCQESHPACLEFHHLDPSQKETSVSKAIQNGWGMQRTKDEMAKCIVLCANCHKKEHWQT